ncbi:MAG: ABC transporter permease [Nanoarchaeota archaeon]|nr:ABC transporter permease [Nanoarchaeota archaeon]
MVMDFVLLTWKNLKSRKMRSWLTIIGVIIGIAAIVSLFLISQGLQNAVEQQFEKMGVKNIRVVPGGLTGPPTGALRMDIDIKDNIERVKGVDYVDSVLMANAEVELGKETLFFSIISYDTDLGEEGFVDMDIEPLEGRLLQKGDRDVVLLGWTIAKDAFDKEIFAKNSIVVEGRKMKIVGVLEKTGTIDESVYMPLETAQDLLGIYNEINVFVVNIKDGIDITNVAEDIRHELERDLDESEFTVYTPEQLLNQINDILGIIQIVLVGIAAVSLLVGAIGIMNAMFTSVLERTREIGVMKAIGAKNRDILLIFLIESGFIGLFGGVIGAIIGVVLAKVVQVGAAAFNFSLLLIIIDWRVIVFSLVFAFFVGVISGIVPALKAAKLQPVDALRYE